jgi:two-component system cell cycle response regulator DivK
MDRASVLIIEDNIDNYELVRYLLERAGYQTLWARSGREGIEMAKADHPDLIIMDLSLPEMDGWTATGRIKSDPEIQHIPVIALTAHTLPGDRKRALDVGCDGYLSKPINLSAFHEMIEEKLSNKRDRPKDTGGPRL